jgi:hypothetical protein
MIRLRPLSRGTISICGWRSFDKRFVEVGKRITEIEARFSWKIIGLLGVQIVIFSLITKYL